MSRAPRRLPVNRDLVDYYMEILCPSVEFLLTEMQRIATKYNIHIMTQEFDVSAIREMLKLEKATATMKHSVLTTLRILTQEAHSKKALGYTPETLPVLEDLDTVPPVLVEVIARRRAARLAGEKVTERAVSADQVSGGRLEADDSITGSDDRNGSGYTKAASSGNENCAIVETGVAPISPRRVLSSDTDGPKAMQAGTASPRLELMCELAETIASSRTPQVLYALVLDGSVLKCLMDGLDGATRSKIRRLVVRGWYWEPPGGIDTKMRFMHMVSLRREQWLYEIAEGAGYGTTLSIDYYNVWHPVSIYGLMYGEGVIYYGLCGLYTFVPRVPNEPEDTEYRETGTPMYRCDASVGEQYMTYRNMLMYGTPDEPPYDSEHIRRPDWRYPIG